MNYNERIGILMREYREKANMTQIEVGKKMGVGKQAVSNYELGLRKITMEQMDSFCKAVGITMNEFADKL